MHIAYYRVSTERQSRSGKHQRGLGLEAQKHTVKAMAEGQNYDIIASYTEVESGRKSDDERPQLHRALAHCRRSGAVLIVAKLDRLARNVAFVSALMQSRVQFVCCDMPFADAFTIHILAAVAEKEAKDISERTKAGLAAAKRNGTLLGSAQPDRWVGKEHLRLAGLEKARVKAARVNHENAVAQYTDLTDLVRKLRSEEGLSWPQTCERLNELGYKTRCYKDWIPESLRRVMRMCGVKAPRKMPEATYTSALFGKGKR